jgi:NADPH:quinone reductase
MRAMVCTKTGGPEMLVLEEIPDPIVGPGDVLVEVKACLVTIPDLLMIQNKYQIKPELPFVPGGEVAGVVRTVGEGVTHFRPGDRVLGTTRLVGGLAERCALSAETSVRLTDDMGFVETVGLLYGYGTSQHALLDRAMIRAGESLLVLGAAGGVGLAAVEIGRLLGARVIAAASTEQKLELCQAYGASETINYATADLKSRVRELTGGMGADVVFDPVGGEYAEPALRSTAWNGRYLVVGFASGEIPRPPLNLALLRGCSITGVFWGSFVEREPDRHRANIDKLVEWCSQGLLRPHTSAAYPLHQATEAFRSLAERRVLGKVVVTL